MSGTLTAEREGPHVKLVMSYADPDDHIFMVERYDGTTNDYDGEQVEIWTPIHTGQNKFVEGDTDYEIGGPQEGPDGTTIVVNLLSPRKYRAEAYRRVDIDFGPVKRSYPQGQGDRTAVSTL